MNQDRILDVCVGIEIYRPGQSISMEARNRDTECEGKLCQLI